MGCCFSDESEERSPLLGRQGSGPHTSQPSSGSNQHQQMPGSARRFNPPPSPAVDKGIAVIKIKKIGIASVDKRLQDHGELFNTQVRRLDDLESSIAELMSMFPEINSQNSIVDVFKHVRTLLEQEEAVDKVSVKRRFQHCMEVVYEEKEVPMDVVPAFLAFNQANRLVKEIIDKEGPLLASIQLVVKDEKNLRREVLVASLGSDGPDCLKACMDNVTELRRAVNLTEDIRRRALVLFEQLKAAISPLSVAV